MSQKPTEKKLTYKIVFGAALLSATILAGMGVCFDDITYSFIAAVLSCLILVIFFLPKLISIFSSSNSLQNAFFANVSKGKKSRVKQLIADTPNLIRSTDQNGCTALHRAVIAGKTKMATFLLSQGAEVNAQEQILGFTPLHLLSCLGYKPAIVALQPKHASLNGFVTREKEEKKITQIFNLLIENGADVNLRAGFQRSPLHMAAMSGFIQIVQGLIDKGADPRVCDDLNFTPLHYAAYGDYEEVAKTLIDSGADYEARAELDYTPLHTAAERGAIQVAKVLLEKGADPTLKTKHNRSPMTLAAQHNHEKLAELIQEKLSESKDAGSKND